MASMVDSSAQAIAEALAPSPSAPAARWRWGTVVSVSNSGTMNVSIGGATVAGIRCAQHVMGAQVGDRVRVMYCGTEAIVDAVRASARLMTLPKISNSLWVDAPDLDRDGDAPSESKQSPNIGFLDKDGEAIAYFQATQLASGTVQSMIRANKEVGGSLVYNVVSANVTADGDRTYSVSAPANFRKTINAVGASDQSAQNVLFSPMTGTAQNGALYFNVTNENNATNYGDRMALIINNAGIQLYNSTDQATPWQLTGLSGSINLTSTSWAYLVGSSSTVDSGNFVRWRCRAGIVFVQVMYRSSAGVSATAKSVGTIPSGYRPDAVVEVAAYLGASNDHIGTIWVDTGGAVMVAATASASAIYGTLSYPL